jgi:heme A synthase
MVKSGLEVDPNQKKEIRVSPYRLATHLGMAFATYGLLLWTGSHLHFSLSLLIPSLLITSPSPPPASL